MTDFANLQKYGNGGGRISNGGMVTATQETFTPSKYQQDIFDWIMGGEGHGIVNAVAGSGKTTTLVKALPYCQRRHPGKIVVVTFTTLAADSFRAKIPRGLPVEIFTFNAFGWAVCRENIPGVKLDKYKDEGILKSVVDPDLDPGRFYRIRKPLLRMVSLLKALNRTPKEWEQSAKEYAVEMGEILPMDRFADAMIEVYWKSVNNLRTMSFGDQIFQPIYRNWAIPPAPWALIDELQDSTPVDMEMARRMARHGRVIGVGDPDQCQPPGTMVTTRSRYGERAIHQQPIETLRRFDDVVSFDSKNEWRINPILEISARPYNGELVVVTTTTGEVSRYTPTHRCYADFSMLRHRWCVYLMRRGNQFRIGKSVMAHDGIGSGLAARMRAEGASEGWILSIHDSSQDAYVEEQILSIRHNLPQTTFRPGSKARLLYRELNRIWESVGDNSRQAEECLTAHGRMLQYPLIEGDLTRWASGLNRLHKIRACNLMDECRVALLDWTPRSRPSTIHNRIEPSDYREILVTREHYIGDVYSLNVARDQNYVADGIACFNSIYLFRGAHPDAMRTLVGELSAAELPLSTCYRCPNKVIESAKKQVPRIEAPNPNPRGEGVLEWIDVADFRKDIKPADVVLCRTTAPLVKRCLQDIRDGRRAYVKGRDVGDGLLALIERIHGNPTLLKTQYTIKYTYKDKLEDQWSSDIDAFLRQTNDYFCQQSERLNRLGYEMELINLDANIETLKVLAESCDYVVEMIRRIEELFDQPDKDSARGREWFESAICYMTGHKCKGLEFDRVFILRLDLCPHPKAKSEAAIEQDKHLLYVMKSRAMQALYFVRKEKDER